MGEEDGEEGKHKMDVAERRSSTSTPSTPGRAGSDSTTMISHLQQSKHSSTVESMSHFAFRERERRSVPSDALCPRFPLSRMHSGW